MISLDNKIEFICLDQFLYRIPRNCISYAENVIEEIYDNENDTPLGEIRENILLASKTLYDHMSEPIKVKNNLNRYILRSSTRTTPFGLFAGVGNGLFSIDDRIQDRIYSKQYYRKTRVSHDWLVGVISQAENNIGAELFVKTSSTLIYGPEFVTNMWSSNFQQTSSNGLRCVIKNNSIVTAILKYAPEYVRIKDIVNTLSKEFESTELIRRSIYVLLDKGFLLSDLRIPMNEHEQLKVVIERMEGEYPDQSDIINKCKKVQDGIKDIDESALGTTEKKYLKLLDLMKEVYDSSDYLCCDLFQHSLLTVPRRVKTDINDLCKFLLRFSTQYAYSTQYSYIEKLNNTLHEYYSDTYVPLTAMWKEIEAEILKSDAEEASQKDPDMIFLRQILEGNNISLLDLDGVFIDEEPSEIEIRPFEIGLNIFRNQDEEFFYSISDMIGYNRWGKCISKYAYEMGYKGDEEYFVDTDYCEVEVSFIPQNHNVANIALADSFSDYVLYYGAEDNNNKTKISIDDIYITGYGDNILFYSKKLNKRLEFVINSNLNEIMLPPLLKFLVNATDHYYTSVFTLLKRLETASQQVTTFPRICYKNFILRARCWNLRFEISSTCSMKEFIREFGKFRDKYFIPDKVFVKDIEKEQHIRIDLTNTDQLQDLFKQFHNNEYIQLQEDVATIYTPYVRDENDEYYYSDFIFYVKTNKKVINQSKCYKERFMDMRDYRSFNIIPFEENWITIKLYIETSLHEYMLTRYIGPFLNLLQREILLDRFFYIRYTDPRPHIRLRLKAVEDRLSELIKKVKAFQKKLYDKEIVDKCCIDQYYREMIRFGGSKVYPYCENMFYSESKAVLEILTDSEIYAKFNQMEVAIVYLSRLLYDMQYSIKEILVILKDFLDDMSYTPEYRKIQRQLVLLINPDNDWNGLQSSKEGSRLYSILDIRKAAALIYRKKLDECSVNPEYKWEVIRSVIHISLNRLVGYNRRKERDICLFSYLTMKSLEAIKND